MNKDFRVSIALTDHPKTIKLMRRLGDRAFFNLMRLWGYVAVNKPNGQLEGVDVEDIEIAADWRGEPGAFVSTLLDLGFLDQGDLMLCVHDWMEHNEFAAYSKERSEKARQAARKRWGNGKENKGDILNDAKSNATSINEQCCEDATADAKSESSNAPSPTPKPSPKPSPKEPLSVLTSAVISHLNEKTGKSFRTTSDKTRDLIQARVNEGFVEADFARAIDNMTAKWGNDPKMQGFLRPITLFSNKMESYVNESTGADCGDCAWAGAI